MSRKYEKKYGKGYLSDVGGNKYWITDEKAYKLTNNDNNNNSNNNKNNKNGFSFNQIYRLVVGVILIMVLSLGFGNGTFEFLNDYKTTYAVENYVKSDFNTFDDINGKTIKFNNKINFDYTNIDYIRLILDVNKIPNYDYKLFTITNNDNFSIDYIINSSRFNYGGSGFIYFSELPNDYNGCFMIRYPYPTVLNLYSFVSNEWIYDGDNQLPLSITFSDNFTNYITSSDIPYYSNLFVQFLNHNTSTLLTSYSDDFYYYDWRFKLHQLSNFRPLFYYDGLNDDMKYSPYFYEERLQEYVDNGDVTFVTDDLIGDDVVLQWKITDYGTNPLTYEILDFLKYKVSGITGDGESLNPPPFISGLFLLDNGDVRPRESLIGNNSYDVWVKRFDNGEYLNANAFGFLDGVFGFLNLPINFTYNIYVFFDFVLRW